MAAQHRMLLLCSLYLICGAELCSSCFTCLTRDQDRASICKYAESIHMMEGKECLHTINNGFTPLDSASVPFSQLNKISAHLAGFEKAIKRIQTSLSPKEWKAEFQLKIKEYIKEVKSIAAKNKAEKCISICGVQKAARLFRCDECSIVDCDAPTECPMEDIYVNELTPITIYCIPPISLPVPRTVTWSFAHNFRVMDMAYFNTFYTGEDLHVFIKITRKYLEGTYACEVRDGDNDIVAQMFFFLNVTRSRAIEYSQLEDAFEDALYSDVKQLPEDVTSEEVSWEDKFKNKFITSKPFRIACTVVMTVVFLFVYISIIRLFCHALGNREEREPV